MIKFKNQVGWTVYKITADECFFFGGSSICDECNKICSSGGYLVPVLNHFMCVVCFNEWNSCCSFYPEDLGFEKSNIDYYERILPVVVSDVPV